MALEDRVGVAVLLELERHVGQHPSTVHVFPAS
jgi:putative aminopeptidase FrvX